MKKKSVAFMALLALTVVIAIGYNFSMKKTPPASTSVTEEKLEVLESLVTSAEEEAQDVNEIKSSTSEPAKEKESIFPKRLSFVSEGGTFPNLPSSAKKLEDFLPLNFFIPDKLELDYNEDGLTDYILIMDASEELKEQAKEANIFYTRLLAIVSQNEKGEFQLDYADSWTVPNSDEGGVLGDPYGPMTTSAKNCFTINAFGGSIFKWRFSNTYEYIDGIWYIILFETENFDQNSESEYFRSDNYKTGIGNLKVLQSNSEICTGRGVDFTYQLEPPLTITEFSQKGGFPNNKEILLKLEDVVIPEKHSTTKEKIMTAYRENSYAVVSIKNEHLAINLKVDDLWLTAIYNSDKKTANLLDDVGISVVGFFEDRFYYITSEVETTYYENGAELKNEISTSLYSTTMDGTDKRLLYTCFAYDPTLPPYEPDSPRRLGYSSLWIKSV